MTNSASATMSRRQLLIALGGAGLAGCAQTPSLNLIGETMSATMRSSGGYPRTRAEVDALPYAQMGIRLGTRGDHGILVLSEIAGSELRWVSANQVMVATRFGRIVKTVGLQEDLRSARFFTPDALAAYSPEGPSIDGYASRYLVDTGKAFGIEVESRIKVDRRETIEILGQNIDTLKVIERIRCDRWRWEASNTYWLSLKSSLVWKSQQHYLPDQRPLELDLLKRVSV